MQSFRTVLPSVKSPFHISHADRLMFIGSCFSENIGRRFQQARFTATINPFGQQYNPASIAQSIELLLRGKEFTASDLFFYNEQYHSFAHHGSFSRSTVEETLELINAKFWEAATQIKTASVLYLTPGTSHVFRWKSSGEIVSNCHKLPGHQFEQQIMTPQDIYSSWQKAIAALREVNPALKIVFTVSPVRYLANGAYQNSVSKAHLFAAIFQLHQELPNTCYFPAYELMMDDLRDYRFYAEDMIHPNAIAIDYVWQYLGQYFFTQQTTEIIKTVDDLTKAMNHRPRNAASEAHRKFLKDCLHKMKDLSLASGLNFDKEIAILQDNLG
ncbi:MAG: GSCFA domain-containing protein [Bacteroidetes bacterium]|nr:GSCFA domain-containing protein [Bacteroidota bacterium]